VKYFKKLMKINIVYDRDLYLTHITPLINELEKRGHAIIYNSSGGVITIASHISDLKKWHNKTPLVFTDHRCCPGKGIKSDYKILVELNALLLLSGKYYEDTLKSVVPDYTNHGIIGYPKLYFTCARRVKSIVPVPILLSVK